MDSFAAISLQNRFDPLENLCELESESKAAPSPR